MYIPTAAVAATALSELSAWPAEQGEDACKSLQNKGQHPQCILFAICRSALQIDNAAQLHGLMSLNRVPAAERNTDFLNTLTDIFRGIATALEPNEAFVTEVQ